MRRCAAFDDDGDVTVTLEEPGIARWCELIFFKVADDGTAAAPTGVAGSPAPSPSN